MLTAAAALLGTPFCFGKIACCNPLQLVNTQTDHWGLKQSILYASVSDPNACLKSTLWKTRVFCACPQAMGYLWSQECLECAWDGECSWQHYAVQAYLSQFWTGWLRFWEEANRLGLQNPTERLAKPTARDPPCSRHHHSHLYKTFHPQASQQHCLIWLPHRARAGGTGGCCRKALASCLSKRHCSACVHLRDWAVNSLKFLLIAIILKLSQ